MTGPTTLTDDSSTFSDLETAKAEIQTYRTQITALKQELVGTQKQLAQLQQAETRLCASLTTARAKPLKTLGEYIRFKLLTRLSKAEGVLPEKMRARFGRSAAKRNPQRDTPSDLQPPASTIIARPPKPPSQKFDLEESALWKADLLAASAGSPARSAPPLVSIILPTKDRAHLLPMAIGSVLAQSYQNWELIIIDDGSTDGTPELIQTQFSDPRIRLLAAEGAGVCDARNTGLRAAQGSIITYLDSDNRWLEEYLELTVLQMARSGAKTSYAVLRGYRHGFEDKRGVYYLSKPFDYEALKIENFIDINIFAHHRDMFEIYGGFDTNLRRMVDWDLIIRYCADHPPTFCNFVGVEYDNSVQPDRITKKESRSYLDVIRNKHLIDWPALKARSAERDPEMVSIIICVYNNPVLTHTCLTSLFTHEAGRPFEVVIVDNGSDPETVALLQKWAKRESRITLILNPTNMNFALGNNLGFAASRGAHIVCLNNDTEVTPEWLRTLTAPLEDPQIRGVQPKLLFPDGTVQAIGLVFSEYAPFAYGLYTGLTGDHPLVLKQRRYRALTAACIALRASEFAEAGGFDPLFVNGQEDVDLCLRMGEGAPVFTSVPDCIVWHHEGKSAGRGKHIPANRKIFAERWRGKVIPDDMGFYAEDQIPVTGHRYDNQQLEDAGLGIYVAQLALEDSPANLPAPLSAPAGIGIAPTALRLRVPCPRAALKDRWGDYHFAVALAGAMARQGIQARIDFLDHWADPAGPNEIDFVFRGLSQMPPRAEDSAAKRVMWIISHPDKITDEELNGYDLIFVASGIWAETLAGRGLTPPIIPLLQCTVAERFHPEARRADLHHKHLFVGNSRKVLRPMVAQAQQENLPLDIYGEMWDGLAPAEWIRAENIPNVALPAYYAGADVVLNDHWESMREMGFVSNRVFDVLACAAPLVTDPVAGMPEDLQKACTVLQDGESLQAAIQRAQSAHSLAERLEIAQWIRETHSFNARARNILEQIGKL